MSSDFIILDLDNTICDDLWRYDMIKWESTCHMERYHDYHSLAILDFPGNRHLFSNKEKKIIVFTARPETYRDITENWLNAHNISPVLMLMRGEDDHSTSVILKNNQWQKAKQLLSIDAEHINCAYDDRHDVVHMYQRRGLIAKVAAINDSKLYHKHGDL